MDIKLSINSFISNVDNDNSYDGSVNESFTKLETSDWSWLLVAERFSLEQMCSMIQRWSGADRSPTDYLHDKISVQIVVRNHSSGSGLSLTNN